MSRNASIWKGRFPRNEIISLLNLNRPFNLAESMTQNLHLRELLDLVGLESIQELELGYGSCEGLPALRAVVSEMCNVPAEHVLATTGTALALALVALEVCRPGDEVVLLSPCFPPGRDVFCGADVVVREVRLEFDAGYVADPERIDASLTEKTRLVCLASPQNPSGVQTSLEAISAILANMARRAPNALLFVDETYRQATYGERECLASAAALDPRILTASSVSKAHGAPALRVGWLTVPDRELRERLTVAKMNLVISGSVLDETLAAGLLRQREAVLAPRRALLGNALAVLETWHETKRVDCNGCAPMQAHCAACDSTSRRPIVTPWIGSGSYCRRIICNWPAECAMPSKPSALARVHHD